ncbi:MAG: preprotein translocase subunit SecA [Candidatus Cloacimonadota bacterium]|nr:MAG: preprotein translocase subunit SecA [Candidatus Cloacimonadota bacterium]
MAFITNILKKVFGTQYERNVKKIQPIIDQIKREEEKLKTLSDEELQAKTNEFKQRIRDHLSDVEKEITDLQEQYNQASDEHERDAIGIEIDSAKKKLKEDTQKILDQILPEAYAVVRETCRRLLGKKWTVRGFEYVWDMVPYDVQLIGAIALHQCKITEMATGEGKTLVATMPLYLNALVGKGAHLITVNDYLAQRDSEWMSGIYNFLGLSVGCIHSDMSTDERKAQYNCDITYGTNSEFGFDYLRDNMAVSAENIVQRGHFYAIVDEVDSVLIDEARTPLIISGPVSESRHYFRELNPQVRHLVQNQLSLVNRILKEAENLIDKDGTVKDEFEFGQKLLTVRRGLPKSKKLLKILKDGQYKKMMNAVEGEYLRNKNMHLIDEQLFFVIDERQGSAELTDKGQDVLSKYEPYLFIMPELDKEIEKIEQDSTLSIEEKIKKQEKVSNEYFEKNEKLHNIKQLLRAYSLFERDKDYIVVNDRVVIVDEFTGRPMPGRRFSEGLHQALEAKELVKIKEATQTLATITIQNYFKKYEKLAGMTGTAITEENEFNEIYKLPVMVIPTNEPVRRIDYDDVIFRTKREKYNAIIDEIEYWNKQNRPVLVGTISVEVSETLSRALKRRGINHSVLNAKYHEQEANIVKDAGQAKAVTIATNMAGRGTDIKLGNGVVKCKKCYIKCEGDCQDAGENAPGSPEMCKANVPCGLHIIGTERHESRRIDRQLRGRSGRQGDPGSSRFYLSLEDDLMRLFGSDRIAGLMARLGLKDGESIKHPWMSKAVENAQKKVEAHNFEIRKQLLKYDDVMNQQREVIYSYRRNVLKGLNLRNEIIEMMQDIISHKIDEFIQEEIYPEDWPIEEITEWFNHKLHIKLNPNDIIEQRMTKEILAENIFSLLKKEYEKKESLFPEQQRELERYVVLKVVDEEWKDHLYEMDRLREGIGLQAYAQKDPLIEYKKESFELFNALIKRIEENVITDVFTLYPMRHYEVIKEPEVINFSYDTTSAFSNSDTEMVAVNEKQAEKPIKRKPVRVGQKIGRNDPCPCGSGKKYKNCCGRKIV